MSNTIAYEVGADAELMMATPEVLASVLWKERENVNKYEIFYKSTSLQERIAHFRAVKNKLNEKKGGNSLVKRDEKASRRLRNEPYKLVLDSVYAQRSKRAKRKINKKEAKV